MRRYILKSVAMSFLFLLVVPSESHLQESSNVIHPKKEVIVAIKYGEKNGEFGYKTSEPGGFFGAPRAFAFDSGKNVYIADGVQKIPRVQEFNDRGEFVRKNNVDAEIRKYIMDIAIHQNNLYVLADNIQVFSLSGKLLSTIKYAMSFDVNQKWTDALYMPSRIEIDSIGNIYLSTQASALVKLSPDGAILDKWSWVDHYLDTDGNLFIMNFFEKSGKVVKYGPDGNKLIESTCDAMFATPSNQKCKLPTFIDKKGENVSHIW